MFFEIHFCTKDSLEDIVFCFPSKIADLSILITNLVQGVTLHLVLVVRLLSGYQTKIGVNTKFQNDAVLCFGERRIASRFINM